MQKQDCIEPRLSAVASARVYVNPAYGEELPLGELDRLPEIVAELPGRATRQAGRRTCWEWHPEWHDGPGLIVRQYAHGGLLGPLFGALFVGESRMLREFRAALYAVDCGVPTARPVALRVEPVLGPLVRAHFVTEFIPDARNLLELCSEAPVRSAEGAERIRIAQAVADTIADLHDAGILHADLNLKNILVRIAGGSPRAFIIDFDRARLVRGLTLEQRMHNLLRLDRSVVKWADSRAAIRPLDRVRVVRHYLQRYPEWQHRWKDILRRRATSHLSHILSRKRR